MATITKSYATVITHQAVTHPGTVVSSELDVSTKFAITLLMYHALVEAVANTNPGKFLVQISGAATGNASWKTVGEFDATISTADTEAMTATEPVGEKALAVAATAGFVTGDELYIQDTGTLTDSEWALCREINANTTIDLVDGLKNQKDNSDVIWNDADKFVWQRDITSVSRIRVLFMHEGAAGANCHIEVLANYGDSIG